MKRLCAAALVTLALADARAETPWCAADPVDRFQYLRRLSLDLRQRPPSLAEYEALVAAEDVPADVVDRYLASDDFAQTIRAYHRDLLWPSLRGILLFNAVSLLTPAWTDGPLYVLADERSSRYRGNPGGRACADREQTAFEPDGTPIPGSDGLDGWVRVEPYWAPGTKVKVCAYDAQAKLTADDVIDGVPGTLPCHVTGAIATRKCGCGPRLSFCTFGNSRQRVIAGLEEQLLRLVDDVVRSNRPYSEVLTTRDVEVNGPVSHYLRWQWGFAADVYTAPDGDWTVPEVPYVETDRWVRATRGPRHAGVLTLPAYLLRFQTNRGRAHRFHNAFLCQPFQPHTGGLQVSASTETDIAKRPGCSYCHQTLEPAAAYWGRFAEQGLSFLNPPDYPVENEACRRRNWVNDPLLRWKCVRAYVYGRDPVGVLRAYEFARDGSPEAAQLARHADAGPRAFAETALDDGRFASCTVSKWWEQLLRRAPTEHERAEVLPALVRDFRKDADLKALIKAIVTNPAYRRTP